MSCQKEVEQPRNIVVVLYVVREHGDGAGEGKRGVGMWEVVVQDRVGGAQDGTKQLQLREGRLKGGEHKVSNAEEAQAGGGSRGVLGAEDQQQNLDDVVVALKVAQHWMPAEDLGDDVGQVCLAAGELLLRLCGGS